MREREDFVPNRSQVEGGGDHKYFRGRCRLCNAMVSTKCIQCNVFLCLKQQSIVDSNCFIEFHTKEHFTKF